MPKLPNPVAIALMFALLSLGACSKKAAAPATESAATSNAPAAQPAPAPAESTPATNPTAATEPALAANSEAPAIAMETAPAPPPTPASTDTPASPTASEPAPAATETPAAPAPAETPPAAASATTTADTAAPATPAAPAKPIDGAPIVQGICFACHQSGMNGAPKFANKVAWGPRIAQGRDKLYEHAMKGLRGMPPRGGNPNLSDDEIKAAVDYMVKAAGGYPN